MFSLIGNVIEYYIDYFSHLKGKKKTGSQAFYCTGPFSPPSPSKGLLICTVSFDLTPSCSKCALYIYMKFNSAILVWAAKYLKGKISAENKNHISGFFRLEIAGKIRIFAGGRKPQAKANTKQRARILI